MFTDPQYFSGADLLQSYPNLWHQGAQVNEPVASRNHHDDCDVQPFDILLEDDIAIDGQENIEQRGRQSEQCTVL